MRIETSSGSTRERWVKALLPAAIIVMVYMLLVDVGHGRQIKKLRDDLQQQQQSAVTENELASVAMRQRSAARDRDQLQERISEVQTRIAGRLEEFTGGSPTERMMQIVGLCQELSIGLLAQKQAARVETSKLREKALQTLESLAPPDAVIYRELHLVGKYSNMVTLMRRLPESVPGVVPLGIELLDHNVNGTPSSKQLATSASGERTWRVYILM